MSLFESITWICVHISVLSLLLGTDYLVLLFRNVYLGIRLFIEIYWGIFISEKVLGILYLGTPTWVKGSCSVDIGLCV